MRKTSFVKILLVLLAVLIIATMPVGCKKNSAQDQASSETTEKPKPKTEKDLEQEAAMREDEQQKEADEFTQQQQAANNPSTSNMPGGAQQQPPDIAQIAVIETNKGVIKFGFFPTKAPRTVENFIKLANDGFYNGIKWHRVEPGFVIQGGDPNSRDADPANDGLGGPGYKINAEFNDLKHLEGTVAMARAQDPNSAGSQFYICLGPQPNLDNNYTIFGQVIEGLDVVHNIQVGDLMNKITIVAGQ